MQSIDQNEFLNRKAIFNVRNSLLMNSTSFI